ncbi:hypothetical protein NDU88_011165 [Pleurodeles waltl]|uniref:Golgi integral membrane protein 4 n=1 Tax=Pleurodeles waltl TaxID=8319 RepID=A0AAV7QWS0_PLEWA|nr:hypothetical protein NDU88_011165 [Pleurodeles waltl]
MGPGACGWRRQKGLLQTGFCLLASLCLGSVLYLYQHLQEKVHSSESLSLKFKQQQETLSAQLQVVYEHRSRLERSLQKERGEHKKTKEDFLVYKLEAQEALNKEKQDAMNRYGALTSQHKILKNQHEEVKKQLLDLQVQHNSLKLENRRAVEGHNQKYAQLQQEKENQVLTLQDTISKLREESKLLRKAYQEVHAQLLSAQDQLKELHQLKEALQRMPSFKELGAARGHQQFQLQAPDKKLFQAFGAEVQQIREQTGLQANPLGTPTDSVKRISEGAAQPAETLREGKIQGQEVSVRRAEPLAVLPQPALPLWPAKDRDGRALRFSRTVNSIQAGDEDQTLAEGTPGSRRKARESLPVAAPQERPAQKMEQALGPLGVQVQSWQDLVNRVNTRKEEEHDPQILQLGLAHPQNIPLQLANPLRHIEGRLPNQEDENKEGPDDEELEMDAGMIDREEDPGNMRQHIAQEPMMPENVADPAHDPNNQGEDEFEEAALERPAFDIKVPQEEQGKENSQQDIEEPPKKDKETRVQSKAGEEANDEYQEDQEQDMEDHGGEVDDPEDMDLVQENKPRREDPGRSDKKIDYY